MVIKCVEAKDQNGKIIGSQFEYADEGFEAYDKMCGKGEEFYGR